VSFRFGKLFNELVYFVELFFDSRRQRRALFNLVPNFDYAPFVVIDRLVILHILSANLYTKLWIVKPAFFDGMLHNCCRSDDDCESDQDGVDLDAPHFTLSLSDQPRTRELAFDIGSSARHKFFVEANLLLDGPLSRALERSNQRARH
jgi:hypothetical protein